jgi:hypothetical protein
MSAFTRLYYAERGLGAFADDASYAHPFEDAFHDPPVPIVPEEPYADHPPSLWRGVGSAPELRLPRIDPRYAARNSV